jgi:hypothetical protein
VGPVQSNVAALVHGVTPSPQTHAMRTPSAPQTANVVVVVEAVVVVVVGRLQVAVPGSRHSLRSVAVHGSPLSLHVPSHVATVQSGIVVVVVVDVVVVVTQLP